MQSVVSATSFVPASKAGTCFGSAPLELQVSLSTLKGVRADWEWSSTVGSNRFRFPLRLTSVARGSDADRQGLKAGDTVVAVRQCDEHGNAVEAQVVGGKISPDCPCWFVSEEVNAMLLRDRACSLRVLRQQPLACASCEQHSLEEVRDSGGACLVCTSCGVVCKESLISEEAEWRSFADDDSSTQKERVGAFAAVDQPVVSTFVSGGFTSGLVRANARVNKENSAKSKAEAELLGLIEELCTRMELTEGIKKAAATVGERFLASKKKGSRTPKEALAAACVLCGCREQGVARTPKEVLAHVSCELRALHRALKLLKLAAPDALHHRPPACSSQADQACKLLPRFCTNLGLLGREAVRVEKDAADALSSCPASFTDHRHTTTLAGAALARVSGCSVAQVSAATGAAASTILNLLRAWPACASARVSSASQALSAAPQRATALNAEQEAVGRESEQLAGSEPAAVVDASEAEEEEEEEEMGGDEAPVCPAADAAAEDGGSWLVREQAGWW